MFPADCSRCLFVVALCGCWDGRTFIAFLQILREGKKKEQVGVPAPFGVVPNTTLYRIVDFNETRKNNSNIT